MNTFHLALIVILAARGIFGQSVEVPLVSTELRGDVQSIEQSRIYVRISGRNIGERIERIRSERYDDKNRLVEEILHGDGYARTLYSYDIDKETARLDYFDVKGAPAESYKPGFAVMDEAGLCREYTIRREPNSAAKIDRTYELCGDGSSRATVVDELNQRGDLIGSIRKDAKGRAWQFVYDYASDGTLKEYRFTEGFGTEKAFTITVILSDHKFDDEGNWTRITGTSFNSRRPGELIYQYNEVRSIVYRDSKRPAVKAQ